MRRTRLFQIVAVVVVIFGIVFVAGRQSHTQSSELGYRESWAPEFNRNNVKYRATEITGVLNPDDLTDEGARPQDAPYYVLNKSVVFGPYEKIPSLNFTGAIELSTSDWCRRLTRDGIVDHGGYTKTYFTSDKATAVIMSITCSTYEDGYRSYRYDEVQPAVDDGIYITISYYCPTEQFGLDGYKYRNQTWASTASIAELIECDRAWGLISDSIRQGMSDYDVFNAEDTAQISGLNYTRDKIEVVLK